MFYSRDTALEKSQMRSGVLCELLEVHLYVCRSLTVVKVRRRLDSRLHMCFSCHRSISLCPGPSGCDVQARWL
jgi:hypothetical protein